MKDWVLIVVIAMPTISSILSAFIIAYTKKRAENIATKKDIENITDKIENVKFSYSKELEEFKSRIIKKHELEIIITETKVSIYKDLVFLKSLLLKRSNNIGNEIELNDSIFSLIIEISININSNSLLTENIISKSLQLTNEQNKIIQYIDGLRISGKEKYSFSFVKIIKIVEELQSEILK